MVHLHGGTRFLHTESALRCNFVPHTQFSCCAAGTDIPPRLQPTFSWAYPIMADFRPGGSPLRCILALSIGRAGFGYPFFLLCRRLARGGSVRRRRHWINRSFIWFVSDIILQELAVVNPPPYPNATSRIIITVKPAAKASAPGPESPRVGSSSAATT